MLNFGKLHLITAIHSIQNWSINKIFDDFIIFLGGGGHFSLKLVMAFCTFQTPASIRYAVLSKPCHTSGRRAYP